MQIVFNNVDGNFNTIPIADVDASLLADENAAAAILDSMFTDQDSPRWAAPAWNGGSAALRR